jgi:Fuc2NAc and GlcNAc transferase
MVPAGAVTPTPLGPVAGPTLAAAFVLAALLGVAGTGLAYRYARARALLDRPNHRSSHATPTPHGGGLAVVGTVFLLIGVGMWAGLVPARMAVALLGGGLVAAVGWIDDLRGLGAAVRALAHLVAAIWGVAWLGGMPSLRVGAGQVELGFAGSVLAVLGTVWLVNAYNFMDGIDGIAGVTAVLAGVFGAALLLGGGDAPLAFVSVVVAGASAGFLVWNWPPARIFLGDVGSGPLGFLFAMLAVGAETRGAGGLLPWLLLLGVFFVDATVTLLRRMLRRERWYEAHRSHAYQRLVQAGWSHRSVTTGVAVLELLLGGTALVAVRRPAAAAWLVVAGMAALVVLYGAVERARPMSPPRRAAP